MSEQSRVERKDRLFLALDEDHPSTIHTIGTLPTEREGMRLQGKTYHIDEERLPGGYPTGRFILRKNAPDYEIQLASLREMCENGPVRLQEIDLSDPKATHTPEWANRKLTEKEELIEARRKLDERSDLDVLAKRLKGENEELSTALESKDAEIARLKAQLQARK
jgi:hypothetical protein